MMGNNKLRYLTLKLTDKCNLKCKMCGQANSKRKQFKEISIERIIEILDEINTLEHVYLFGGEPLLYSDFTKLLIMLCEKNIPSLITTNGMLLDRFVDEIIDNKVRDIEISIDSHKREVYEKIRKAGKLDIVEQNISLLIQRRREKNTQYPRIALNCVIMHENLDEMLDYYNYFIAKYPEIESVSFEFPMITNCEVGERTSSIYQEKFGCVCESWKWFDIGELRFTKEELDKIEQQVLVLEKLDKVTVKGFHKEDKVGCCCYPFSSMTVLPDEKITFCTDFPDVIIGNLSEMKMSAIWNSAVAEKFRKYLLENDSFPICECCTHYVDKISFEHEQKVN